MVQRATVGNRWWLTRMGVKPKCLYHPRKWWLSFQRNNPNVVLYCLQEKLFYARRTKETIIKGFHFNSSGPIFCSRAGIAKQKRLFASHCSKKKHWHLLSAPLHLTTSLWSSLTMSPLQYLKPISAPKMKLSLKWSNRRYQFLWRLSFYFLSFSHNKVLPVCVLHRK